MTNRRNMEVDRRIYFYRTGVEENGQGGSGEFDIRSALERIDSLDYANFEESRYLFEPNGDRLVVLPHDEADYPAARFGRIRLTGLPQLELYGRIRDLDLEEQAGLLEPIHVVFFPNGIVGAEYNHFGPRVSRLADYMNEKSSFGDSQVSFQALLQSAALEQINRLADVRQFTLRIPPGNDAILREADTSLADAFTASQRIAGTESITVTIKIAGPNRVGGVAILRRLAGALFGSEQAAASVLQFRARGRTTDTNRVEPIDFLGDKLVSVKRIIKMNPRSRALNPQSAFQAIVDSYRERALEIRDAASIS